MPNAPKSKYPNGRPGRHWPAPWHPMGDYWLSDGAHVKVTELRMEAGRVTAVFVPGFGWLHPNAMRKQGARQRPARVKRNGLLNAVQALALAQLFQRRSRIAKASY